MVKVSKLGPGTEGGKMILNDFLNWKTTGFKPTGRGVGGVDHYRSNGLYQTVSLNAFRSQAKNVAKIALEQMPGDELEQMQKTVDEEEKKGCTRDSQCNNPFAKASLEDANEDLEEDGEDEDQDSDYKDESDDDDFSPATDESGKGDAEDDKALEEEFEEVSPNELNSREPIMIRHPKNKKVGLVFFCEGDVMDVSSNQFEFHEEEPTMTWWVRVPKERLSALRLLGVSGKDEDESEFGFSDANLMVVQAAIDARIKMAGKPDKDGNYWQKRQVIRLPFQCEPVLCNKQNKRIKSYMLRRSRRGFTWGYFWLRAKTKERAENGKRIGGQRVQNVDASSVCTEQTIHE